MVIIITGAIGIGKTTVCEKVVKIIRSSGYSCGGILTHKAAHERLIALDIQTGEKVILASTDNTFDGPRTPRYSFNPEAIKFGIRGSDHWCNTTCHEHIQSRDNKNTGKKSHTCLEPKRCLA